MYKPSAPKDEHLFAVLSDVHGNYCALRTVVADAEQTARNEGLPRPRFICLGDYVDYGPQPNQCMDWITRNRKRIGLLLRGNHDAEASRDEWRKPTRVGDGWWPITIWTRLHLAPRHRRLLLSLPEIEDGPPGLEDFICFHSTPSRDDGYIGVDVAPENVLRNLGRTHLYGLFGHTHYQALYSRGATGAVSACYAQPEHRCDDEDDRAVNHWHKFPDDRAAIINPGSVGQPRLHARQRGPEIGDNDPRAAYLLLHRNDQSTEQPWQYQWRRVSYPQDETIRLLERLEWTARRTPPEKLPVEYFSPSEFEALQKAFSTVCKNLARVLDAP